MIAARPTVRYFAEAGYQDAHPLSDGGKTQLFVSIGLLELFAGREVFCDELDRELLLRFRSWRLAERPAPACPKHGFAMRKFCGTEWCCQQRGCPRKARHAPAVAPTTANKDVATLRAVWSEAIDQGFNAAPKKRIKKLAELLDNPTAWTLDELGRILESCRRQPRDEQLELFMHCSVPDFWEAMALLLYDSGSRIKAILLATPADYDRQLRTVTLRAKTTKGKKCQVVHLSEQTVAALERIFDPQMPRLLNSRYKSRWLTDRWREILIRAGLPSTKKDLFHKVRRTTVTQMVRATGSVEAARDYVGHSAASVTLRYVDQGQLEDARKKVLLLPRPSR